MTQGFYFTKNLTKYIGQTVTIFTTSGGESGMGFTGVLASVNCSFVSLITQIGPAPSCTLGNPCDGINGDIAACENCEPLSQALTDGICTNRNRSHLYGNNLGSVVEIPIERIAAFVHNAVGASYK